MGDAKPSLLKIRTPRFRQAFKRIKPVNRLAGQAGNKIDGGSPINAEFANQTVVVQFRMLDGVSQQFKIAFESRHPVEIGRDKTRGFLKREILQFSLDVLPIQRMQKQGVKSSGQRIGQNEVFQTASKTASSGVSTE